MSTITEDTSTDYTISHTTDSFGDFLRQVGKRPLLLPSEEVDLAQRIEVGIYAEHLLSVKPANASKITSEDIQALVADGLSAQHAFMEANIRLVVSVARKYAGRKVPLQDLVQEGSLGMHRAMQKFDYAKGFKFSTYAILWIEQAVRASLGSYRSVRLPEEVERIVRKVRAIHCDLHEELGRVPTPTEVGQRAGLDAEAVAYHLKVDAWEVSLDANFGGDTTISLADILPDDTASEMFLQVENDYDTALLHDGLLRAAECLTEQHRQVLWCRMGWETGTPMSGPEVAQHLGISRWAVRTADADALRILRNFVRTDPDLRVHVLGGQVPDVSVRKNWSRR